MMYAMWYDGVVRLKEKRNVSLLPTYRGTRLLPLLAALILGGLTAARADEAKPFLHPLFTDNMVLQRGTADSIWGWTTPGNAVNVRLNGQATRVVAGADGKWVARIGPFHAGGPYTLTVKGPQSVTLKNILIGDVWLCSGQSNMEFGVGNLLNAKEEIAHSNHPNIRLFTVARAVSQTPLALPVGRWQVCGPKTITEGQWSGFSAVAYCFGRELEKNLHVPIGLIHSSWGGTPAEAWTSADALAPLPDFAPVVTAMQQARQDPNGFGKTTEAWYARHDPGSLEKTWADPDLDASGWKAITEPVSFQQSGIAELAGTNDIVWLRREFDLPAAWSGKDLTLHLGPIDDRDTTYINGTPVGGLNDYAAPRDYKVLAALLKPGRNVLAVRVLDTGGAGDKGGLTGKADAIKIEAVGDATPAVPLAGPWLVRVGAPIPADDPAPVVPGSDQNAPTTLYNGMVSPLLPFGLKGAIWYQGESNAGRGKQYQALLPALISDWRKRFAAGDFPFLVVQLANFDPNLALHTQPGESGWAELREAQLLTAQHVPRVGLAVTEDIGAAGDIHPKNKQEVGRRLALAAEAIAYGRPVEYGGPLYQGMTVEGSKIRLKFTHLGGGLVAKPLDLGAALVKSAEAANSVPAPVQAAKTAEAVGAAKAVKAAEAASVTMKSIAKTDEKAAEKTPEKAAEKTPEKAAEKLLGFAIAGADGVFVWADARIDGDTVVVSSPTVPQPTDVRYAWADSPVCNLYSKAGLPAPPFRTGK
jgi:sialate O-acetylesterase